MNVKQIALGGGNPNNHPEFIEILRMIHEDYGIIPSYTTNGRYLSNEILSATKKYCGAVAISLHNSENNTFNALYRLLEYGIKSNIHFVLTPFSIPIALRWFQNPDQLPVGLNAIIFLNYKPVGKFKDNRFLLKYSTKIREFFNIVTRNNYHFKIGFDSCMVSGIVKYTQVNPIYFEACEAGRFSAFISEDLKMYPCSFMIENFDGIDLKENTILDAWQNANIFNDIRKKLKTRACNCIKVDHCYGGCPIFDSINLCNILI